MMVILHHVLANEKYSNAHSCRVSLYAQKIGESLGLDAGSSEDIRIVALLQNVRDMRISNEVLYKVANIDRQRLCVHDAGEAGIPLSNVDNVRQAAWSRVVFRPHEH